MKASQKFLIHYLEGSDKCFVIPVYQRNYDWKREHCQQLLDDILGVVPKDKPSYFIGSIVSIYNDDSSRREYVIIDGQQRLTTISLMLLAMHNLLEEGAVHSTSSALKTQLKEEYLVNRHAQDEKRIRLKPIKDDNNAFVKLFEGQAENFVEDSNITQNYFYFLERIRVLSQHGVTIDQLYEAIKKLMIVDIELKRGEDNPQLIFESLNSTGKQLDEADLVRNFILMDKVPAVQEKFYNRFWHPIEKNTDFRVGEFLRHYLTYILGTPPRKDRVYLAFKNFVQTRIPANSEGLEILLEDLLCFSRYYHQFLFFDTKDEKINRALKRIDRLQVTTAYPYMLDAFHAWEKGIIDASQLDEILYTIESFVFRRIICNAPTNAVNKVFAILAKNIRKIEGYEGNYLEIFKYLLSSGSSSNRFPSDEEFLEQLLKRDVYNQKPKNRIHLFERMENHDNREKVDVEAMIEATKDGLSFEHIMPQTLTPAWKKELGEGAVQIHEMYLHTLGNITLTAYNSQLTNKTFAEKFNQEKGFKDSKLWLNHALKKFDKWGEAEIQERANLLAARAMEVWRFPKTCYEPAKKLDTQITLFEEYNFTGTKPLEFLFLAVKYSAASWRAIFYSAVGLFYSLDPVKLKALRDTPVHKRYLSAEAGTFRYQHKLAEGIYLNRNMSAAGITGALQDLIIAFDLDESDLTITLYQDELDHDSANEDQDDSDLEDDIQKAG